MTVEAAGFGGRCARARAAVQAREPWARDRRTLVFDFAVALAATVAEFSLLLNDDHTVRAPMVLLVVAAGGALTARRRAPWTVLVMTLALSGALVAIGEAPGGVPVLVALYTVADLDDRRLSLAALPPTAVLLAMLSIVSVPPPAGVWALGAYAQTRRRYVRALEERAEHLQREREQLARIAVHEERASIARELHDIVAHSVTVMLLGVRGARDVLRVSPDRADDTLARVETNGEQSLVELRRILTVLRAPGTPADSRPAPSLTELDELVVDYRDAGLPIHLRVTGERRPLPGGVELCVYRVIQEALTNALKHSRPRHVTVTLAFLGRCLDVEVANDSTAPALGPTSDGVGDMSGSGNPAGHGLIGMRERVGVLGGELEFGHRPGGGFRVAARLPLGGEV